LKLFAILKSFSPSDGEVWTNYCQWRGIKFKAFHSIDGMLRPSLFNGPETNEDWGHVLNASFMLSYFTDCDYAAQKLRALGEGELQEIRQEDHDESSPHFLGYEVFDFRDKISFLTNWGNDIEVINQALTDYALLPTLSSAQSILTHLLEAHGSDGHLQPSQQADGSFEYHCHIASIYNVQV
jgi:hypothetical protein